MFTAHCPSHGGRVLLGVGHITAIRNGPDGILVEYRCPCGSRGSYLTGRRPAAEATLEETGIATAA